MPLFDFRCRRCDHHFEALVRHERTLPCPACAAGGARRLPGSFQTPARDRAAPSLTVPLGKRATDCGCLDHEPPAAPSSS